jgi:hypothetical protein
MKFWQWVLLALVIVGLGLVARPTPGMAASFEKSATTLINYGGDMWLMGDPDGGSSETSHRGYAEGYRLNPVRPPSSRTYSRRLGPLDWMRTWIWPFGTPQ